MGSVARHGSSWQAPGKHRDESVRQAGVTEPKSKPLTTIAKPTQGNTRKALSLSGRDLVRLRS